MTQRPSRQIGYELLGYMVTKNQYPFLRPSTFPSIQAAKQATEAACDYPLEWRVRETDGDGFDYTEGGHPRAIARKDELAKHAFTSGWKDPDPNIEFDLGHAACRDSYFIAPDKLPIYEEIKDAEFVSNGYYVQPGPGGEWEVRFDHRWVGYFPTRVEAIASIWDGLAEAERERRAPRKSKAIEWASALAKFVGVAAAIVSIYTLVSMWLDGSLAYASWQIVWQLPALAIGVILLYGAFIGALFLLGSMPPGVIQNIFLGVGLAGLLALPLWMALEGYRTGNWFIFILSGGIGLLSVVAAIWEGGKCLLYVWRKRTP